MTRRGMLGIAALAVVSRYAYIIAFMRHYRPNSDADSYFAIARAVERGQGYVFTLPFDYVHATAIRPPLTPTVFAVAMWIFGVHLGVAQAVNVLAGSAAAVVGAVIAARIGGRRAGWIAGVALALYVPLIANDVTTLIESFAVLLFLGAVLLLIDGRTVLAGVALGLMMLDRASAQWLVLVFGAWVVWRFGWWHALRFAAVAVLVVSPWVIRNWVHVGGPVIVSTNGYNINAKFSSEAESDRAFVDAYFDGRFAGMRTQALDEVDLDGMLQRHGLSALRKQPSRLAEVVRANLLEWFEIHPSWSRDAERLDGRNLTVRDWTWPLFFPVTILAIYGLVRTRRSPASQLLMIGAGYFTVVCAVSIAVPRLRSVFDAVAAIGFGVGIAALSQRDFQTRFDRPTVRPVRAVASIVALSVAAVVIAGSALEWRHVTQQHARQSLATTLRNDAPSVTTVSRELASSLADNTPPRISSADNDHLANLLRVLGVRAPEASSGLRGRVGGALRSARVAVRETYVVSLLSASEYLNPVAGTPSLARVRDRYENEVRPTDPVLEPWDQFASGATLRTLGLRLEDLRTALHMQG